MDHDSFDVSTMTYAITGAGGALCGVMASSLAQRGAKVALLDIDLQAAEARAREIRAAGGQAIAVECDVLDEQALEQAAADVEQWGPVDAVINGAGGNHPSGSTMNEFATLEDLARIESHRDGLPGARTFFDIPISGFRRVFDLNFFGTVLPTRAFGKRMASRGGGTVLNMSSMSALTPLTKVGAYSAAKGAVANLTRWLAVHLAPVGVRVNALAPGFFMTEQLRFLHVDQETGEYTPRAQAVIAHTPMRRYGEPEELVGAVIWLTTEASSFVTGIVVPIDGGFSSYSI
jgi:NAD(P)-dependent dehydrogenase (short-subunit alcohol dehydrogenase family)